MNPYTGCSIYLDIEISGPLRVKDNALDAGR
jgi:hypothetical protein